MDRVISYIANYMTMDRQMLNDEWQSGKYENLEECPSFETVKAYCDVRNILSKCCYGKGVKKIRPKDFVTKR